MIVLLRDGNRRKDDIKSDKERDKSKEEGYALVDEEETLDDRVNFTCFLEKK